MREPTAAGTYYQRDGALLKEEIDACYHGVRGPGALPLSKQEQSVKAIIAPNSPYTNCGQCMSWTYKELAETPTPDVYIILGANHHSEESGISMTTFNTPLGFARVDQELAKAIIAKSTIGVNEEIHMRDHAIEVQLPFLLHAKAQDIERVKILPILLSDDIDLKKLAIDIKESLLETGRTPIFIVSTVFTRHGPLFHYVPFTLDVQKKIYEMDKEVIEVIKAQEAEKFSDLVKERVMNIDGARAIELVLHLLKPCHVRFEQYYTSGDVLADYKNSVSYAAVVFAER